MRRTYEVYDWSMRIRLLISKWERWNVTFNMLLISLMDDTQPYRAEVRDRSVHS